MLETTASRVLQWACFMAPVAALAVEAYLLAILNRGQILPEGLAFVVPLQILLAWLVVGAARGLHLSPAWRTLALRHAQGWLAAIVLNQYGCELLMAWEVIRAARSRTRFLASRHVRRQLQRVAAVPVNIHLPVATHRAVANVKWPSPSTICSLRFCSLFEYE